MNILIKFFKASLVLIFVLVLPIAAKADCGWFTNSRCEDVKNSKAACGQAENVSFCSAFQPPPGFTPLCCCCDQTLSGCCEKIDRATGAKTTMNSTIAECYRNNDWAQVKWHEGQTAHNNNCIQVKNGRECRWFGSNQQCMASGFPISASLQTCVDFGRGDPDVSDVCCCREINNNTPPPSTEPTTEPDTPATVVGEVKLDYTGMTNPLRTVNVAEVIGRVIKAILAIIGSIFLMMVIYGGFTWMTAAGNDTKVAKGRSILMWAIIGIIVIFLAWMLVAVVFEALAV